MCIEYHKQKTVINQHMNYKTLTYALDNEAIGVGYCTQRLVDDGWPDIGGVDGGGAACCAQVQVSSCWCRRASCHTVINSGGGACSINHAYTVNHSFTSLVSQLFRIRKKERGLYSV